MEAERPFSFALFSNSRGKWAYAEENVRAAIALKPNVARYQNALGDALMGQKKYGDAEIAYRKAVKLAPTQGVFRGNLAGALLRQEKSAEARKEAREAIRLGQHDHWVYKSLGLHLPGASKLPKGTPASTPATGRDAKRAAELFGRGRQALQDGQGGRGHSGIPGGDAPEPEECVVLERAGLISGVAQEVRRSGEGVPRSSQPGA
jgi:tetratricopeptide (TPR) repeat protein